MFNTNFALIQQSVALINICNYRVSSVSEFSIIATKIASKTVTKQIRVWSLDDSHVVIEITDFKQTGNGKSEVTHSFELSYQKGEFLLMSIVDLFGVRALLLDSYTL